VRRPLSSSLEFALLGLLSLKPCSGYDLRKVFATTPMGHFSDSPGAIYPALRRLRKRNWVSAAREKGSARKREVFEMAAAGRAALLQWLKEPFGREEVVHGLDTLLLRFAFFDGNLARREALEFLTRLEREVGNYIAELARYASMAGLAGAVNTGSLAFANGVAGYRTHRAWARRAIRRLSADA
jgi:DNA-binding PadR family transcriptional regulator